MLRPWAASSARPGQKGALVVNRVAEGRSVTLVVTLDPTLVRGVPSLLRPVLNLITTIAVVALNGLAGSGSLSGESIGTLANRYASYFLPAGYVFSIWSLIYLALIGFTVYQLLPQGRRSGAVERVGYLWVANGLLNIGWIVAFSFGRFALALLIMLGLLVSLIVIWVRVNGGELSKAERVLVRFPFGLYFAWITVAVIANASQLGVALGWSELGLGGPLWSVILMVAAVAIAAVMVVKQRAWIFPLVVAWALVGIARRYEDVALVESAGYGLAVAALLTLLLMVRRYSKTDLANAG